MERISRRTVTGLSRYGVFGNVYHEKMDTAALALKPPEGHRLLDAPPVSLS
jgi:hypothetical protein